MSSIGKDKVEGQNGKESGHVLEGKKGFGYSTRRGAARPGNTRVRDLLGDESYTEAVADFLGTAELVQIGEGVIAKKG